MIMLSRPARSSPEGPNAFEPGDLVRHRRYGYRGVVVALDLSCQADESWYQTNQTQPRRDQAWYHVLVDGSGATTYAAEENLGPDPSGQAVEHPLLEEFFEAFEEGRYRRNEKAWPA